MPRSTIIIGLLISAISSAEAQTIRGSSDSSTADPLTLTSTVTAFGFTSSAPSGVNGFGCTTNGCRFDFGAGASDYARSDGTSVIFNAPGGVTALNLSSFAHVTADESFRLTVPSALDTCAAGHEGRVRWLTGTGGTNTGAMTKICLCQSDGAAVPAYAWQRLNDPSLTLAASIGTSTTCP